MPNRADTLSTRDISSASRNACGPGRFLPTRHLHALAAIGRETGIGFQRSRRSHQARACALLPAAALLEFSPAGTGFSGVIGAGGGGFSWATGARARCLDES